MLRLWYLPLAFLVLGGCAGLETVPANPPPDAPGTSGEAMKIADDMAKQGHWSGALELLDAASRKFPGDPAIEKRRESMLQQWQRQEREFEDLIMVGDAENQKHKVSVLEKLSLAQPNDLIATSRRIYWKEVLSSNLEALTACGEFHVSENAVLARRCFQLASGIATNADMEQRLAAVGELLRRSEDAAAERRRVEEEKKHKYRAKLLLDEAKAAIEAREYRRALDILENVAELQPNNSEVPSLQEEAMSMISPQIEALVKLGDHLYLDEQLSAAVATWQAALILKPDDEAILARIDRAKTVLNRLGALRRQQNLPADTD